MKTIEQIFTPDPIEDAKMVEYTPEQRLAQSGMVREMVTSRGFGVIEQRMSQAVLYLQNQLLRTQEPNMIRFIQGQLTGIHQFGSLIQEIVADGETLQNKIQQTKAEEAEKEKIRKDRERKFGTPPAIEKGAVVSKQVDA